MKKIVFIIMVVFAFNVNAQTNEGDISLGGGLAIGSGVLPGVGVNNSLGLTAGGYYTILESKLRAGIDFIYYFENKDVDRDFGETITEKLNVFEINLNAQYIFFEEQDYFIYGIGGINITSLSLDEDYSFGGFDDDSLSSTDFGLNIGAGFEYKISFANLFAEAKYGNLGGDSDQFVFLAGLRFLLK